jgi:pimeloyl-ACP methyl ester carboxylesterase
MAVGSRVIYLGQRGTLKADPFLSCIEFDQFYAEAVSLSWEDPATAEKSDASVRACRNRLASERIDLATYNTTESAADVADLRVALGIKDWNIYGLSYGTDLALQTLRDHPEGIRAVILDSVLPPQVNLVEQGWASAASSYKAIFDGCDADTACASAFPDMQSEFIKLVNDLSVKPRTVTIVDPMTGKKTDVVIDGYKLASGIVVSASQTHGYLQKIPALIDNLANGDGTQAAKYLTADVGPPNFVGYGLQFSTECSELVAHTDLERVKAVGKSALPDFPDAVLSLPAQIGFIFGNCQQWAVPPAAQGVSAPATSDIPVLLVSGSFDSATPPSYADEAVKTLSNSRYLMFQGVGHGVAEYSPIDAKCFVEIMQSFLDRPTGFDDTCFKSLRIPPFATP